MSTEARSAQAKVNMGTEPAIGAPAMDGAAIWKQEYTKAREHHWQKIFQSGEYNIYDRDRKPVKFDAFGDAIVESVTHPITFLQNIGDHIRKIDYEFRGEKDIGNAQERLERVKVMMGIIGLFTAFDYVTSKPWDAFKNAAFPTADRDLKYKAKVGALSKIVEVMNDKYATALGNMLVERLTGKRGFVHEVSDKGADTLNVGLEDKLEDWVNGPTLEATQRILFQFPIVGALLEQGLTRLSLLQEKTPLHTATGKMLYMALGVYMNVTRNAKELKKASVTAT